MKKLINRRTLLIIISILNIILSITLFMQVKKYEELSNLVVSRETEIKELFKSIDDIEEVIDDFINSQPQ